VAGLGRFAGSMRTGAFLATTAYSRGMRFPRSAALLAASACLLSACAAPSPGRAGALGAPATPRIVGPASGLSAAGSTPGRGTAVVSVERAPAYGLGDSVMLGSKTLLAARRIPVNAAVSRQFSAAPAIVAAWARAGVLRRNLVIHLGTNGTISAKDCRSVVTIAGPTRRVFLLTVHAKRSWTAQANAAIRACAATYGSRRVIVLDWDAAARLHPGWLSADGIHPNTTGRRYYTSLIANGIARYGV